MNNFVINLRTLHDTYNINILEITELALGTENVLQYLTLLFWWYWLFLSVCSGPRGTRFLRKLIPYYEKKRIQMRVFLAGSQRAIPTAISNLDLRFDQYVWPHFMTARLTLRVKVSSLLSAVTERCTEASRLGCVALLARNASCEFNWLVSHRDIFG